MCGFSGRRVQGLRAILAIATVNVLDDDEIRQGIDYYGQWPTIPALYQGRVHRRLRHHDGDVRIGRAEKLLGTGLKAIP